jgi:phosphate transport system substrate-binding protein
VFAHKLPGKDFVVKARATALVVASVTLAVAGCGGLNKSSGGGSATLVAAGSTLVAPLVAKWSADYAQRAGVTVTYGAIGSGGGIAQITGRTVDLGASDAPLTPAQANACKGCVQVPWALTATLVSYRVKGAPSRLKLTGPLLARIFLGKLTRWNDPAIAKLNPGVRLPGTTITPVYRGDGSGDTYAFTDFLSKVSREWKRGPGVSTQVTFPTGIGGKGNDGVVAAMQRQDGAIGYLAISYVFSNHLDYALVRNSAGTFPVPGTASISAAASSVTTIPPDNAISITNPPASAAGAYPISTFSYAIAPESSPKARALRAFLAYAFTRGQQFGSALQFAPLPAQVLRADRKTIAKVR